MCGQGFASAQAGMEAEERAQLQADYLTLSHRDAKARGRQGEAAVRRDVRTIQGAQRTGYASQGVDVESGSAVSVQADTAEVGELDALEIRNSATRESWGYRQQRKLVKYEGRLARRSGWRALESSIAGGVASVITRGGLGGFGSGGGGGPTAGASGLGGGSGVPVYYSGMRPGAPFAEAP
jgi:hypothetical protein